MTDRIAVHATHEAADKLGGIGTVLQGLLPEPAYQRAFARSLLAGVYHFPAADSVVDDPATRQARGWTVEYDSEAPPEQIDSLAAALTEVAGRFGARVVYGHRAIGGHCRVPVVLVSPQGIRRSAVDQFRDGLRNQLGFDVCRFDDYPAITEGADRRLERLVRPGQPIPDEPPRVVVNQFGQPFPGGAGWAGGRAVFPPVAGLDAFSGLGRGNKYLLELQYHTFAAPALWAAVTAVLRDWAPLDGGYDAAAITLFAHDWVAVPLFWAMCLASQRVGRSVYFAHEARIFRLLAECSLQDRAALLRPVCHPEGYDAALYPYLRRALADGLDLAAMFPGMVGFPDIFHHLINREAARFDRIVVVGPHVRDETEVALRPGAGPPISLCPNGIPAPTVEASEARAAHERLADVVATACDFRPAVLFTGVMRCELSKAPWRNLGLFQRFAARFPQVPAAFLWLSAPRPRPTREQARRWASEYRWPLDHRAGEGFDLRPEEEPLWQSIAELNRAYAGRCAMLYINQFGWAPELLGALDPLASSFADVRGGGDVEVGLSVYEPFGIAPLEPFAAGATCVLSDSCGCAVHLRDLGLDDRVVVGHFSDHGQPPALVDATTLRSIEQQVYDDVLDQLAARLGLADGVPTEAHWLARRAEQIAAAREALPQLSWANAAERYLVPAVLGD